MADTNLVLDGNENILKAIQEQDYFAERITAYYNALKSRADKNKVAELAEYRKMPIECLEEAGVVYIGEMAEMIVPDFISELKSFGVISPNNNMPIFSNRYLIPIKDTMGRVQNFVGYSALADERYIYGTANYYRRRETMYGLENMHLAYEMGYAVLTEGITDTIRLRSLGIKNCFANCGTHKSLVGLTQLNRCKHGVIRIPDRDDAGVATKKQWITNRYVTLNPPIMYKDIDEMLRVQENVEWFMGYFEACVKHILSRTHMGQTYPPEEITIM